MALPLAALGGLVGSLVKPFVESFVKELGKDLVNKVSEKFGEFLKDREMKELLARINGAVMSGNAKLVADELLRNGYVTEENAYLIRRLGDLWRNAEEVSRIVSERRYFVEDIESLLMIAKLLKELTSKVSFEDLGIKYIVKESRTVEAIEVVDERYGIALLLGFAGIAYTQVGMLETPEENGQALEYDAEIKVVKEIPLVPIPPHIGRRRRGKLPIFDKEYLKFEENYSKLWSLYQKVNRIKQFYINAVACFKAARYFVLQSKRQKQKHRLMQPTSLEALIKNYMGEIQYWTYHISPELLSVVRELKLLLIKEREKASRFLMRMGLSDADIDEFYRIVYIYDDFAAGYAGAMQLFNKATKNYPVEEGLIIIRSRIEQCREQIAKHGGAEKSKIVVEEPEPIKLETMGAPSQDAS